jgi:hypothetical protein
MGKRLGAEICSLSMTEVAQAITCSLIELMGRHLLGAGFPKTFGRLPKAFGKRPTAVGRLPKDLWDPPKAKM